MHWIYDWYFTSVWTAFLLYWRILAVHTKQSVRIEPTLSRLLRSLAFILAIALFFVPHLPVPTLCLTLLPQTRLTFWLGAAVNALGLLFAVAARHHIGRNWSGTVTLKQDHELITTGPYAFVRHPIYTGILTGFLGSAIALGQVRGLLATLLILIALWAKLRLEEQWMRQQFGHAYAAYAAHTAALIPFLL